MNIRRLLVPITLVLVSIHAGQAGAQGTLSEPQSEAQCMKGFAPLREEAENRGKAIKAASIRHAPPDEACKLISNFGQAETMIIRYVGAHSAECGIPSQMADQLKAGHKNTEAMLTNSVRCGPAASAERTGRTGRRLSMTLARLRSPVNARDPVGTRQIGRTMRRSSRPPSTLPTCNVRFSRSF